MPYDGPGTEQENNVKYVKNEDNETLVISVEMMSFYELERNEVIF